MLPPCGLICVTKVETIVTTLTFNFLSFSRRVMEELHDKVINIELIIHGICAYVPHFSYLYRNTHTLYILMHRDFIMQGKREINYLITYFTLTCKKKIDK